MGIQIGTQLHTPNGFKQLEAGTTYYFLWSDGEREKVLLVQFVQRVPKKRKETLVNSRARMETPTPLAHLVAMNRAQFELGIDTQSIVISDVQLKLPPWLALLEGENLHARDLTRQYAKKKHSDRVDEMLLAISPLLKNFKDVLAAKNPDKVINKHARSCDPVKNETRVRLAFYCYLVFGRSRDALYYPVHKIGHWDRGVKCKSDAKKWGRPHLSKGSEYGHNVTPELHKSIVDSYWRFCEIGKTMTEIYRRFMSQVLGCRERTGKNGMQEYFHPEGREFPTLGQFDRHVVLEIGLKQVQINRLGAKKVRTEIAPSLGSFTQSVANLMEKSEADGYYCEARPVGLVDGSPLPALNVVRTRDYASGSITGIGFAFGAERASAYRMAKFCEAIDKCKFCSLFGLTITPESWPSIGISPHTIADRGPGATDDGHARTPEARPFIRELPPSYAGQSKAVIESSHPKNLSNDEAPTHLLSDKNVLVMVRQEISRVLKDNESFDISNRIPPELWPRVRRPCPNELWSVMNDLGRNNAQQMSFDEAVRAYLEIVEADVKADGVYLFGQKYDSKALRQTTLLEKVAVTQLLKVKIYVLEACVRHVWIEIDRRIVELDLQVGLRVGDEFLYLSLEEIKRRQVDLAQMQSNFRVHRHAVASKIAREFEEDTGFKWEGKVRKVGRPKVGTPIARVEAAESARIMRGKKSA